MEDNRAEQIEALEVLTEFNDRLVHNMEIIVFGTLDTLNDGKVRVDKAGFNTAIVALSDAIAAKDDARMAVEFENVIPVFQQLGEAAKEVTK